MPTRVPCAAHRLFALALLAAPAVAQMGRRNTGGDPRAGGQADVDMAMAGWEQLSQNPDKMAEVMASLQDPEVAAKAQEMLKDPEYMRAAKAKVAELQAKAQQNGLLDANGQPVQNNMANMMAQMGLGNGAGMPGAGAGAGGAQAREWEAENIARHRSGNNPNPDPGPNPDSDPSPSPSPSPNPDRYPNPNPHLNPRRAQRRGAGDGQPEEGHG